MLILRLSKREDQALIPISTIQKFSAQGKHYSTNTDYIEAKRDCTPNDPLLVKFI